MITLIRLTESQLPQDIRTELLTTGLKFFTTKNQICYGIRLADRITGLIALENLTAQSADISYWLAKSYRGQGYAKKALELLIERAFSELGLITLHAVIRADNQPSLAVVKANRFKLVLKVGGYNEYVCHRDDWQIKK